MPALPSRRELLLQPSSAPSARLFSSFLYVPGAFCAAVPVLELRASESVHRPFNKNTWDSTALHLTQPRVSLLVFTAISYGERLFSLALEPWTGEPGIELGPLTYQGRPP